jgi:hypothetical protein
MKKLLLALLISSPLNSMAYLPSLEQVNNALAWSADQAADAYLLSDIVTKARNLTTWKTHNNPAIQNKLIRLSHKMSKNIKTLTMLSRKIKGSRIDKKRLVMDIISTTENLALQVKSFMLEYKKS